MHDNERYITVSLGELKRWQETVWQILDDANYTDKQGEVVKLSYDDRDEGGSFCAHAGFHLVATFYELGQYIDEAEEDVLYWGEDVR